MTAETNKFMNRLMAGHKARRPGTAILRRLLNDHQNQNQRDTNGQN